jgi:hypothetical protein
METVAAVHPGNGGDDVTVERAHIAHETRYAVRDGTRLVGVLAFDAGPAGTGPSVWKILLPGPQGTEDLYGTHEFLRPDGAQLTVWLTPIVGQDAATQLAAAVDAEPPRAARWQSQGGG